MVLPFRYNLRNLTQRRTTTLLTALAIALTVAVLLVSLALTEGLKHAFLSSGHPLHVIVMRRGSMSELTSVFARRAFQEIKAHAAIQRGADGQPLASLEMVTGVQFETAGQTSGFNITLRGLTPVGIAIREHLSIVAGRWFEPGKRELVAGRSVAQRYAQAGLGNEVEFGRGKWTIVGIMDGGDGLAANEIFGDLNQLAADYNRAEFLSSALFRAIDEAAVATLLQDFKAERRWSLDVQREREYYESQMAGAAPVRYFGLFIAVVMAIGAIFAAMNTMYTAVARRASEIGTLRVLGFSKAAILISFLLESLLLSAIGGLAGCLLVLPFNQFSASVGSMTTISQIVFRLRVTPEVLATGLGVALAVGAIGGLLPAQAAARKPILTSLRAS